MRKLTAILMLVLFFGGLAISGCAGEQPKDLLVKFYDAVKRNDLQTAYNITTPFYQEQNDLEMFKATIAELEADKGVIKSVEVGKQDLMGSRQANVMVTITRTKDGTDETYTFEVSVLNPKGKWKVDGATALK